LAIATLGSGYKLVVSARTGSLTAQSAQFNIVSPPADDKPGGGIKKTIDDLFGRFGIWAIVGSAVGGAVFLAIVITLCVKLCNRKQGKSEKKFVEQHTQQLQKQMMMMRRTSGQFSGSYVSPFAEHNYSSQDVFTNQLATEQMATEHSFNQM
jgi:hypothetical protein